MSRTVFSDGPAHTATGRPVVRPRRVWSGLALALIGFALACVGLMLRSEPLSVGGVVILVLGACLGWAGGVMHDATTGFTPRQELRAVRDGTARAGVIPGAQANTPAARDEAERVSRTTHRLQKAARTPNDLRWAPVAGWTLLLVAAVLMVSQWELVPHTTTGRVNSFRDTAAAILISLSGLRLALTRGRHLMAVAVAGTAGAGLVLTGVLAAHDHATVSALEATAGVVVVLAAVIGATSATSRPPRL